MTYRVTAIISTDTQLPKAVEKRLELGLAEEPVSITKIDDASISVVTDCPTEEIANQWVAFLVSRVDYISSTIENI